MMNRVVLVGRLTRDPELRRTATGTAVTSFSLALDNRPTRDGEKSTSFFNIVAWNQTAENVAKYVRKGSLVGVDGRLLQRSYEKNGVKFNVVEVVADSVQFLEPKGSDNSPSATTSGFVSDNPYDGEGIDTTSDDLPF
ncbi:MAG: single-stranded DNA-binding protein [Paracholeplasma sp.]|nr:single-stranded DNA-binding protein [Paracholeplasma sp.]MDY3196698.1 single-stranded DNA-binding protein [Paracholeplasma sp.]